MLDPQDGLARCLARSGDALPTGIVETAHEFGIEWNATYYIEGDAFVVIERAGRVRTIIGYPVTEIRRASARTRKQVSQRVTPRRSSSCLPPSVPT